MVKAKEFCKDTPESFVVIPAGAFEGITTPSFEIRMPNAARHQIDEQVYPQITYCLPLIKIRSVFYRINTLASFKKIDILEFFNQVTHAFSDEYARKSFEELKNERERLYVDFMSNENIRCKKLLELEERLKDLLKEQEKVKSKDWIAHIEALQKQDKVSRTRKNA